MSVIFTNYHVPVLSNCNIWKTSRLLITHTHHFSIFIDCNSTWFLKIFLRIEERESAIFECRLVGNPKPALQWLKGDKVIKNSTNYVYLQDLNDSYKLVIRVSLVLSRLLFLHFWIFYWEFKKEANIKDSGLYKLVAMNKYGQTFSTCELTVNEGKRQFGLFVIAQLNDIE